MTDNERLADLLFGSNGLTPEDCELRFPPRELPEGARVTRFSPSPTGYLHIGGLFGALVDFLTARVSGGLTYLRIEDTDKKREVADGVSAIINGFKNFGLEFDEGVTGLTRRRALTVLIPRASALKSITRSPSVLCRRARHTPASARRTSSPLSAKSRKTAVRR